jgi:hypothetical protein
MAPFDLSDSLAREVRSATLVSLLLESAHESKRYEAVLPTDQLNQIIARHRAVLTANGKWSADKSPANTNLDARFLLLPTASRVVDRTILTASLIDLNTNSLVRSSSVTAVGSGADIFGLVKQLWDEIDAPCTGTFRVIADGIVLDESVSWGILSDRGVHLTSATSGSRFTEHEALLSCVRKVKPDVKSAEVVFLLEGPGLLRTELCFDSPQRVWYREPQSPTELAKFHAECVVRKWEHTQDQTQIRIPYESTSEIGIADTICGMLTHAHLNPENGEGKWYLSVRDRYARTRRFDIQSAKWKTGSHQSGRYNNDWTAEILK